MITDIPGVFAGGMHCGIKPSKKDLAFIFVPKACASAGVFTLNKFAAACVHHSKKCLKKSVIKAIVTNSGNANAVTGEQGFADVKTTAALSAKLLGLSPSEVAVASTGIIGVKLPMEKLTSGLKTLLANPKVRNGQTAAEAIMTTDAFPKTVFLERKIGGQMIVVAGISKGGGMIGPNMATTLSYLVTNVAIDSKTLQPLLSQAADDSFNMISVDTDTSTNDMVLMMATGEKKIIMSNENKKALQELIFDASLVLAKLIVRDGEGATRVIEAVVEGAAKRADARAMAKNIINSPLVKTAIHGADPNWGRVVAALGKDPGLKMNPEKADVFFGSHMIVKNGQPVAFDRARVVAELKKEEVQVRIDLKLGKASAKAWGCDLTKKYIDINTAYN
jgi:glutamate N-acetyltransferase/amino-acid N-acetyltransferase